MMKPTLNEYKKPTGWGSRHTLMALGFWAFSMSYAMRFNLSLAIVAMVKSRGHRSSKHDNFTVVDACPHLRANLTFDKTGSHHDSSTGEFEWSEAEQGFILGSFFWGYVLTQFPGGIIATKYGGKWPLGIGLGVTGVFALLTPMAARTSKYLLIAARVIQGLGEGVTVPSMHAILAKWAPIEERSKFSSFVYAGSRFGTATTMVISGYLIHGNVLGGWPSVFYLMGIITIIWFILWSLFMHESPANHPRISTEERIYIESSIGNKSGNKLATPWRAIFSSMPFYAVVVGHAGHVYGSYTLLTELPTYLKTILHFDAKQNGWISAIPYYLMWIVSIASTQVADMLISRKTLKTVYVRKICQTISQVGPALALIGAAYSGCDRMVTVPLLTLAIGINGIVFGGFPVNHLDLSPNFAAILMGMGNTVSNLVGFAAPSAAGLILNNNVTLESWRIVFFIAAAIYIGATIFFDIFASATLQPWNDVPELQIPKENGKPESIANNNDKNED